MRIFTKLACFWAKHGTKILTGVAVAGAVATPVLASKATLKAKEKIEEKENEVVGLNGDPDDPNELTTMEKVKVAAPCYIWTGLSLILTIACIISCERIHLDKEAMLAATSAMWESRYRMLDERVTNKLGVEEAKEIKKEAIDPESINKMSKVDRNSMFWVYDEIYKDYRQTCYNDICAGICRINQAMSNYYQFGEASYNLFRRLTGGGKTKPIGDTIGWSWNNEELAEWMGYNGDMWIEAMVSGPEGVDPYTLPNGEKVMACKIVFNYPPMALESA